MSSLPVILLTKIWAYIIVFGVVYSPTAMEIKEATVIGQLVKHLHNGDI